MASSVRRSWSITHIREKARLKITRLEKFVLLRGTGLHGACSSAHREHAYRNRRADYESYSGMGSPYVSRAGYMGRV